MFLTLGQRHDQIGLGPRNAAPLGNGGRIVAGDGQLHGVAVNGETAWLARREASS